jgi:ssDNA-binding Zn-finger/Zn-ribbon topoisomerase 1
MKPCTCAYEVTNYAKCRKTSDAVVRRVRNILCPEHGRADARAILRREERKAARAASTKGWR